MTNFRIEHTRRCEHGAAYDDECLICDDELMEVLLEDWEQNKNSALVDGQLDFYTLRNLAADACRFRRLVKLVELESPDFYKFTWHVPMQILFEKNTPRESFVKAVDSSIGFNFEQWLNKHKERDRTAD